MRTNKTYYLDNDLTDALTRLAGKERRSISRELEIAIVEHLAAKGEPVPAVDDAPKS